MVERGFFMRKNQYKKAGAPQDPFPFGKCLELVR